MQRFQIQINNTITEKLHLPETGKAMPKSNQKTGIKNFAGLEKVIPLKKKGQNNDEINIKPIFG